MTGTGSSSAFAASEAESPSMQYPAPDSVNPSDDLCFTGRTEATEPWPLTDAQKRAAINQAAAAVERTFLAWHESGCMTGAADYTRARNTWAQMLMKWGRVA